MTAASRQHHTYEEGETPNMRNPHLARRRGGPYPHLRLNIVTKTEQGLQIARMHAAGQSFRQIATALDMSLTTVWRRFWWLHDWTLPGYFGRPAGPIPPQRGTAACPRGRPYLPTLDGDTGGRYPP